MSAWTGGLVLLVLATGPEHLALPGFRLHVMASEELEPDALRSLAGKDTVVWLSTRGNMLRQSTAENLPRFGASWVWVKPPLEDVHVRQLPRSAGAWVDVGSLGGVGMYRLGARPLAVSIEGELTEEQARRAAQGRPQVVLWRPARAPTLLEWAMFRPLPGRKWVELVELAAGDCTVDHRGVEPSARVELAALLSLAGRPFPCGRGPLVRVTPEVSDAQLRRLSVEYPAVELEVDVRDDVRAAGAARRLLDRLRAASGSARGDPRERARERP